jgi:hypothetical protein
MDALGLPSFQFMMVLGKIAIVHSDFRCGNAAVPDGMRWSAPQSLSRTRSAADVVDTNDKDAFIAAAKTRQWEREKSVRTLA